MTTTDIAPTKTRKSALTPLQRLLADRDVLAAEVAALKAKKLAGDVVDRDAVNQRLPGAVRALKDLDNEIRNAKRDERDAELTRLVTELAPDADRVQELVEQLHFTLESFNATYIAVRDAATALGVKVGARHSHPLAPAGVEHALRVFCLGRLAVRFPGAADVPPNVELPFRAAAFKRFD